MLLFYLSLIDTPEDRSKFEILYKKYEQLMHSIALRILRNEADAEDAVHEAFLVIAEKIEKISEPVCPKTKGFCVTIVENKAIDMYRGFQRHGTIELVEETVTVEFEYDGDSELTKQLIKLPQKYRSVLLLKHYHGYSTKEIARLLDLTESNVTKIEQRAKAKLAQLLDTEGTIDHNG